LINNLSQEQYYTISTFESAVNTLPAGTYEVTYTISYNEVEIDKKRTIILK